MPNWVSIRLAMIGPEYEVRRFRENCIRVPRDDTDVSLDFEGLLPMPDAIVRTLDGSTQELKHQARMATGYDDWYSWCLAFWGTKWNSRNFKELVREPERYACDFDTAWSYPESGLESLALQYPSLIVQIFAIEESSDWGYVASICGGDHTGASIEISQRLRFLIYDANVECCFPAPLPSGSPELVSKLSARGATGKVFYVNDEDTARRRVKDAWLVAHASLSPDQLAYLQLAEDIVGFLEWLEFHDDTGGMTPCWDEAQQALGRYVESSSNLRFMLEQKRCSTVVDRHLLQVIGNIMRSAALDSLDLEGDVSALAAQSIEQQGEAQLYQWASTAMWRPGQHINAPDVTTLQDSARAAGELLLQQALEHIRADLETAQGAPS